MQAEAPQRLLSIDALRGFDMLWIAGGAALLRALADESGWGWAQGLAAQTRHVEWHGFTFYDLIFPLFLFLAGASMAFSFAARRAAGAGPVELWRHSTRRGLTLVLLGLIYNGLFALRWDELRCASVLGRIGLAWMLAAWIAIALPSARRQLAAAAAILLGYWILLAFVPAPGQGTVSLAPGETVVDWFDRQFLPGRLYHGVRDPEGLLSTLPAVVNALAGLLAGDYLRRRTQTGQGPDVPLARRRLVQPQRQGHFPIAHLLEVTQGQHFPIERLHGVDGILQDLGDLYPGHLLAGRGHVRDEAARQTE